eukprot:COSAG06_NODE_24897_length_649_cov_4.454545_1_plen_59_part_10
MTTERGSVLANEPCSVGAPRPEGCPSAQAVPRLLAVSMRSWLTFLKPVAREKGHHFQIS